MLRIVALLSIFTMSPTVLAEKFDCKSVNASSPYPFVVENALDNERYAPAYASGLVKRFSSYSAVFDDEDDDNGDGLSDLLGTPVFVTYHLKGLDPINNAYSEPSISIERPSKWYRSQELIALLAEQEGVSSTLIDDSYRGIGAVWNRGHLAMSDHAQRISWEASCNTHHFWNAVPQAAALNQGVWAYLETYSGALSNMKGDVWIITGPVFNQREPIFHIGDEGEIPVAVPHQLFKVIVFEENGFVNILAFMFNQHVRIAKEGKYQGRPISGYKWDKCSKRLKQNREYDLRPYLVSLADIEASTGLVFFPTLNDTQRQAVTNYIPTDIVNVPDSYWSKNAFCNFRN